MYVFFFGATLKAPLRVSECCFMNWRVIICDQATIHYIFDSISKCSTGFEMKNKTAQTCLSTLRMLGAL